MQYLKSAALALAVYYRIFLSFHSLPQNTRDSVFYAGPTWFVYHPFSLSTQVKGEVGGEMSCPVLSCFPTRSLLMEIGTDHRMHLQ